jgi:hypothetical protein
MVMARDDCGVNMTLQFPEFSEQLAEVGVTEPPEAVKVTVPIGVVDVPGEASVTEATHVDSWPTLVKLQVTTVVVLLRSTRILAAVLVLAEWNASGTYVPVTVAVPEEDPVKLTVQLPPAKLQV